MADKDQGDGPSLEMPTLGNLFRRKKKSKGRTEDDQAPTSEDFDALVRGEKPDAKQESEPEEASAPAPVESEVAEAEVAEPEPAAPATVPATDAEVEDADYVYDEDYEYDEPESAEEPAPAEAEPTRAEPFAPAAVVDEPVDEDEQPTEEESVEETVIVPPVEDPAAVPDAEPPVVVDATEPETPDDPEPEDDPTTVLDLESEDHDEDDLEIEETDGEEQEESPAPRPKREFTLPPLAARTAAAVTGLVIGLLAVGLTYVSLRGCEAVKGTSSCGTPGFFLLLAIMIILVSVGSALLGAWKVADPTSTSFLAVGLLAVIALLFLIRVIFSPWMVLIIPIVGVITYTASQWLTSLFEDEDVVAN